MLKASPRSVRRNNLSSDTHLCQRVAALLLQEPASGRRETALLVSLGWILHLTTHSQDMAKVL